MPAFNTNIFRLASSSYLESHAFQATEQADKLNNDLNYKFDAAGKAYSRLKKGLINNTTFNKNL